MNSSKYRYCINCMSKISSEDTKCPICGKTEGEYEVNQRVLRPLTVLNGKYLLGKVLGEGGFGITYLGLDLNLQIRVAIKEYFPIQLASRNSYESDSNDILVIAGPSEEYYQRGMERYKKEAQRLVKLDSLPGIVKVMNFFYENNTSYMVMEYIQGESLKEYVQRKKRVPWKEAISIVEPVVKSLSVLHKNGIIHRDISPDNIMRDSNGVVTLIDFGAAKEFENNDERSKTIALKHGYAPPEQYQSNGNQGPWTDVYALCATLYYMISGTVLPSAMAIFDKNTNVASLRSFDGSIPKTIEAAINQGLNVNIKYRIHDMGELFDHLYKGRKIIPWRKIILALVAVTVIVVGVILLSKLTGEKASSDYELDNVLQSAVGEETSVHHGEGLEDKEIDDNVEWTITDNREDEIEVNDTAVDYVLRNGLKYTNQSLINYVENANGVTVTGTDSSLTDVVIPEEIDGMKVTSISGVGNNITGLVLPDSLLSIEKAAFKNSVYLESIYIPSSVSEIAMNAFENCLSLTDINISSNNTMFHVENGKIIDAQGNTYN